MNDDRMEEAFRFSAEEIKKACGCQGLHPSAVAGLTLFNSCHFFEAHEALELAWREETGAIRGLYKGILQVGVGYYHALRGNFIGAQKMFDRAKYWIALYPDTCCGIDVGTFKNDFLLAEHEIARLGVDQAIVLDQRIFKPVKFQSHTESKS
jgi:uncharacterized protein